MTLDTSGNVGIGGSPGAPLDVNSGTTNTMAHFHSTDDNGFIELKDDNTTAYIGVQDDYMYIGGVASLNAQNLVINDGNGNVGIGTTAPGDYNSHAENLVVASSGNTGITIAAGTSSDSTLMFADGTGGTAGYRGRVSYDHNGDYMYFHTGAAERMRIDTDGRLAIGNTSTAADADIGDSVKLVVGGGVVVGSAAGADNSFLQYTDIGGLTVLQGSGNYGFRVFDDNSSTPRFQVNRSGKVGIGTASPSEPLTIRSSSENVDTVLINIGNDVHATNTKDAWIRFEASIGGSADQSYAIGASNDTFRIVRLGTRATAPHSGTQVMEIGTQNVLIGNSAGEDYTGSTGVYIGTNAGVQATSAAKNVVIGDNANSLGVTTGANNVVIGFEAGDDLTSGWSNMLIGVEAGRNITEGTRNVCLGADTGATLNTASENVFIGNVAGAATTSGGNVAIGSQCFESGNFTSGNVGVGWSAGEDCTGTRNTLIGAEAGRQMTSSDDCTAIGHNSMGEGITTGNLNTAVGRSSLKLLTSGGQNCALGNLAGNILTTGNYNIFIGNDSRPSSNSASAQIVIGANLTGTANNAVFIGTSAGHSRNDFLDDANWDDVSDVRKKTNIEDSTLGLQFLNKLRPVIFNWKSPSELPEEWQEYDADDTTPITPNKKIGLIAQEVKEVIDELGITHYDSTWGERENGQQELALTAYIVPLIKAIQELSAKNDALEARIATLEG